MRDNVRQHLKENNEKNYDKVRLEMLSMMSVEERAKEAYTHYVLDEDNQPSCAYIPAYIQGDTERKIIDDKEKEELINLASKRIADVEASRSRILQRREFIINDVIDKVYEWVEERKQPVLASDTDDTIVGYSISVEEFIEWLKSMGE